MSPLAAKTAGAKLWDQPASQHLKLFLEGEAGRFPTEVVPFSQATISAAGAVWFLEVDLSDLDRAAPAALRLFLNLSLIHI